MTTTASPAKRPRTAAEFLTWPGDGRAKKYQFVDGEVKAMAPASAVHGLIQATLVFAIKRRLVELGSRCKVLTEPAVTPKIRADDNVRVPDIGVICSSVRPGQIVIEDPMLLIEILSPSNKSRSWANVWANMTIPSVTEIVVVQSTRVEVQVLRCSSQHMWPDRPETIVEGGVLRLDSIGFECRVEEIYSDTPLV